MSFFFNRKINLALVLWYMLVLSLLPLNTVRAEEPLAFVNFSLPAVYSTPSIVIHEGDTIDRRIYQEFIVKFNRKTEFYSVSVLKNNVYITDAKGELVNQQISQYGFDENSYRLEVYTPMKKNENYTLNIKGGSDGVKDMNGGTLPSDYHYNFKTSDKSLVRSYDFSYFFSGMQIHSIRFSAEKGPFSFRPNEEVHMIIEKAETQKVIYDQVIHFSSELQNVDLLETGEYNLILLPTVLLINGVNLTVQANELLFPGPNIDAIELRKFKPFEILNDPFDLAIQIYDYESKVFEVKLDTKVVAKDLIKNPNGPNAVMIDPLALEDGIHSITVITGRSDSNNESSYIRYFVVDRVSAFKDVPLQHWAHHPIEIMSLLNIVNGRSEEIFALDQPITREEFAKLIALTLELKESESSIDFVDVRNDSWAMPYIQMLAENRLIEGDMINGQSYFYPKNKISRAEAATIIARQLEISNKEFNADIPTFKDFNMVPNWAKPSVFYLSHAKWIDGFDDGSFYPNNTLTRAQAAKILSKFLGIE